MALLRPVLKRKARRGASGLATQGSLLAPLGSRSASLSGCSLARRWPFFCTFPDARASMPHALSSPCPLHSGFVDFAKIENNGGVLHPAPLRALISGPRLGASIPPPTGLAYPGRYRHQRYEAQGPLARTTRTGGPSSSSSNSDKSSLSIRRFRLRVVRGGSFCTEAAAVEEAEGFP